jgi:hypothetical protein
MDIGMLWYDDDHKRSLGEKVARAVEHYKTKYGVVPTVCYVNPTTLKDGPETSAGVQIRKARDVMADHFWIGMGDVVGNGNGSGTSKRAAKNGSGSRQTAQRQPVP